ncbi:alkaline phosphatase : Response regulator receiver protein OS=Desulfococcus multivorans DSM 2059 GN=dsmv_0506 PE=4 SV=1: Response_reg [Gemmata massiliana]|uniref:Response regulatory domain-containing protein n=1 Tax=Gemmata massiliana TaxID=1210884 RepID=A0A6P2D267_9BACT|nr:response regulator [Gemmata massiliana]VTR95381.1 alkaline phosphatase : Response regulator receiver protein OS=Desulfococcus multivorans DSM 2059 GN=dsmv_0506 PE=4 SV=1: Response_reg [Gemmata massiliana]
METSQTVLVVDDTPGSVELVAGLLESAGFRVHTAQSAGAALDAAHATEPDVVVLEPLMEDGWEVTAWLRRRDGRGPALVALTRGPWDVTDSRAAGFGYLVMKADDPQTLLAAVALCASPFDSNDGDGFSS